MRGAVIAQLPIFLAVAAQRSFSAAARTLGISPSAASQSVVRLERELGAALLVRTTRSVSLTDVGARLVDEAAPAMSRAAAALGAAAVRSAEPSGVLRLNVPRIACGSGLRRVLAAYARKHPAVRVDVVVDERPVDIVREGFDLGIRARESVQADMVVTRLTPPIRFVVVGAKRYFAARGRPKHPRELVDHACLGWHSLASDAEYRWEFVDRGRDLEVAVAGPITSNDVDVLIACAEESLGLAFVTEDDARASLSANRLETTLDAFTVQASGLFLYYPRTARDVPKLKAFVECARESLPPTAKASKPPPDKPSASTTSPPSGGASLMYGKASSSGSGGPPTAA